MFIEIRKFSYTDMDQIVSLFYETVHSVNARHYTQAQLEAWAPIDEKENNWHSWKVSMSRNITYIAEIQGKVVGFSDMTYDGHIDRLYVHKDFQGQGIASTLVNTLVCEARKRGLTEIDTEASITAKPFFEHHGFQVIQRQTVQRRGVKLDNFKMFKRIVID